MERTTPEQRKELYERFQINIQAYLVAKLGDEIIYLTYDGTGGEAVCKIRGPVIIDQLVNDWVNAEVRGLKQRPDRSVYEWEPKANTPT